MSPIAKLAGFAVVLLLVFGGAALAGGAIGPERDDDSAAARDGGHTDSDASHGGEPAAGKDSVSTHTSEKTESEATRGAVRGLAVADNGLELAIQQTELPRGRETELAFSIVGADGKPVRDFEVEHEKRMHLIVVRRDGEGFQHLHPELGSDGIWRVRADVAAGRRVPGLHRLQAGRAGADPGGRPRGRRQRGLPAGARAGDDRRHR